MNKIKEIFLAISALALASCSDNAKTGENAAENAVSGTEFGMSVADVNTAEDAIDFYIERMTLVAESLEKAETNKDIDKAAKLISSAAEDYKQLDERLSELDRTKLAQAFGGQSQSYMDAKMKQYAEAQGRVTMAVQKISKENPRAMMKLALALQKLQPSEAY